MSEYAELEEEICEGCDGRGRCPDRPCVEDARYGEFVGSMLRSAFKAESQAREKVAKRYHDELSNSLR